MLSKQIEIIENALSSIAAVGPGFIDQVNDFPAVAILRPSISRTYIGDRKTIDRFSFIIRGYVSTDGDSINASEALARNIEYVVQTLSSTSFYSARVLTVETDEGLLSPYGMCDVLCEVDSINE